MRELGLKIQQVICNRKEKANLSNCNDSMEFARKYRLPEKNKNIRQAKTHQR